MKKFKLFGLGRGGETTAACEPDSFKEQTPAKPGSKRVLIIDDDPVFSKATAMALQSAGCEVRLAQEASEAIAALAEEPADVLLVDINFPPDVTFGGRTSWDGFQTIEWLRGLPGTLGARFIIVSSSDLASDRQRARQIGAMAYLQKPLDLNQLLAVVNEACVPAGQAHVTPAA
ncbi:MAG TPA: response regulator [Candidatus Paceibacterota bacterium]|nr:response regulator [Verrucomicrobiota bacterium]HSA11441.1 response regulator [Candidatus Paceibacterota bacterium]